MREQVIHAHDRQAHRFGRKQTKVDGKVTPPDIRKHCRLEREAESLLKSAMEEFGL